MTKTHVFFVENNKRSGKILIFLQLKNIVRVYLLIFLSSLQIRLFSIVPYTLNSGNEAKIRRNKNHTGPFEKCLLQTFITFTLWLLLKTNSL